MNGTRYFGQAARSVRKNPGLSVTVVLLLGIGIGGTTAVFSVMQQVLFAPIAGVERSQELVRLRRTQNHATQSNQSYPDYLDLRARSRSFQAMAAERLGSLLLEGDQPQMAPSAIVTGNYFRTLGVRAAAGRLLNDDDDRTPGNHPVAVISEAYWRRSFQGDPAAVGRTIVLNHRPFTIVGVAAAPFAGLEYGEVTAVWIPMMMWRTLMTRETTDRLISLRRAGWLTIYGRLAPGTNPATAKAELDTLARALEVHYPENAGRGFVFHEHVGMTPDGRAELRKLLLLLFAAVALVLVIACGNVATIMLARAAARNREMAIRLALGAGRRNLLAQSLAESALLGLGGAALGAVLAPWIVKALGSIWAGPGPTVFQLNSAVLLFSFGISSGAVLLFGIAPAWAATRAHPGEALRSGSSRAFTGTRLQRTWVVAQVALSVALVAGGSLVLRSMQRILAIEPGYRTSRLVMAGLDLSVVGHTPESGARVYSRLLERAAAIPGVRSATLAKSTPTVDWSDRVAVQRSGDAAGATLTVDQNRIAPAYFRTLGIPLLAGRDFNAADTPRSASVAIVSKALADRLWPGVDPLGKEIVTPVAGEPASRPLQVVGVAADARYRSILDAAPPLLYIPMLQSYDSIARLMIATDGPAASLKNALAQAIRQTDSRLPFRRPSTVEEQLAASLWRQRAAASLLSLFGLMAIALACAGIYGVTAYAAAQRTREIGIRMALGADRAQVLGQVLRQAVRMAALGIALGLPLAVWTRPVLQSFLYDTGTAEPVAFLGVPLLFLAVALGASAMPARRAAATDPVIALRQE